MRRKCLKRRTLSRHRTWPRRRNEPVDFLTKNVRAISTAIARVLFDRVELPSGLLMSCFRPFLSASKRSVLIRRTPRGPVYVNIDTSFQEAKLETVLPDLDIGRRTAPLPGIPAPTLVSEATQLLTEVRRVVFLMGRLSRSEADWQRRIALVERLGAEVITDIKTGATFPSSHRANIGRAGYFPDADVIVNLDWVDFGGTLRTVFGDQPVPAEIVSVTLESYNAQGWVKDGGAHASADICFLNSPGQVVAALHEAFGTPPPSASFGHRHGRGSRPCATRCRIPVAALGGVGRWGLCGRRSISGLLVVIINNRSFYNDEVHQEAVAKARGTPGGEQAGRNRAGRARHRCQCHWPRFRCNHLRLVMYARNGAFGIGRCARRGCQWWRGVTGSRSGQGARPVHGPIHALGFVRKLPALAHTALKIGSECSFLDRKLLFLIYFLLCLTGVWKMRRSVGNGPSPGLRSPTFRAEPKRLARVGSGSALCSSCSETG